MKKILLILLISQSLFSQIKYIESDTDSYIDFTNKVVKLKFENHSIEGKYINVDGKDFYTYMLINGGNDVWVVRELSKMGIMGMDILKGDYNTILKEFKKGRKYKKSQLLFSNLPASDVMKGYRLISESEKERYEKMNIKTRVRF